MKNRIKCLFKGHNPRIYIFPDLRHLEKQGVLEKYLDLTITDNYKMEKGTYCHRCMKHLKTESFHILELSVSKGEITLDMRKFVIEYFYETLPH